MQFIAVALCAPALVGWIYDEIAWVSYAQTAAIAGVIGIGIQIVASRMGEPASLTRIGGMQLFSAESTGLGTDKLSPRIVSTARRLWQVYLGMTVVLAVLLGFGGMNVFDSICHSFGTVATGGFSTKNASIGAYQSAYIEWVVTIFMLLSGVSFAILYRLLLRRQPKPLLRSPEVRLYLTIFAVFAIAICVRLMNTGTFDSFSEAARASVFQTAAIITTTGYGTADFNYWPAFTQLLLVLLMFLGGCAGSTAGGVKVIRLLVVFKHATVELKKLLYPTLVQPVTVANRTVTQSTMEGILGFFLLYIITTVGASMLVLATGVDLITGVTAVISAMNSIGPGLGEVGPAGNYSALPDYCKAVLSVCMIVGRLEIYTVFVLFHPAFWRH
jgi:trk system potassium uptake protein TrkH